MPHGDVSTSSLKSQSHFSTPTPPVLLEHPFGILDSRSRPTRYNPDLPERLQDLTPLVFQRQKTSTSSLSPWSPLLTLHKTWLHRTPVVRSAAVDLCFVLLQSCIKRFCCCPRPNKAAFCTSIGAWSACFRPRIPLTPTRRTCQARNLLVASDNPRRTSPGPHLERHFSSPSTYLLFLQQPTKST